MLEAFVAVVGVIVGVVVGVTGVVTSYAGHRHSVREAARVAGLAREVEERERAIAREAEERERAAAREVQRRAEVVQASLVQVMMSSRPSPLADQWLSYSIQATNGSDQPIRDVALRYDGRPLPTSLVNGLLQAGESVGAQLPASDVTLDPPNPVLGIAEFTDAAGVRWRRSTVGILERQHEGGSWSVRSPQVARFQQPEGPVLRRRPSSAAPPTPAGPPAMGAPPVTGASPVTGAPPRSQKMLPRPVSASMVLVGAVLVAWAVWSLSR